MKILIFNRNGSPTGGVERYLADLCVELTRQGHKPVLLCSGPVEGGIGAACSRTYCLPEVWGELFLSNEARAAILRILDDEKPDIAYAHLVRNAGMTALIASRVPTVRFVHDFKITCPDGKRMLHHPDDRCERPLSPLCMMRAYTRRCMPRSPAKAMRAYRRAKHGLFVTGNLAAQIVASRFMKRILMLNSVSEDTIIRLPYFPRWPGEEWTPAEMPKGLLFVGRLVEAKGILELIRLMREIPPDITLDVVGDGPARSVAERYVRDSGLGDRVVFFGWLDGEDLRACYRRNAALVIPSLWAEPFGIVGLEAAVTCRPAIAFDVGGISDWLRDGETGFLVPPRRFDDMKARIKQLTTDSQAARAMGEKAKRFVKTNFSRETHMDRLMNIFDTALKSRTM